VRGSRETKKKVRIQKKWTTKEGKRARERENRESEKDMRDKARKKSECGGSRG